MSKDLIADIQKMSPKKGDILIVTIGDNWPRIKEGWPGLVKHDILKSLRSILPEGVEVLICLPQIKFMIIEAPENLSKVEICLSHD